MKVVAAVLDFCRCCMCVGQPPIHAKNSVPLSQVAALVPSHGSIPNCSYYSKESISTWQLSQPLSELYFDITS
ncbi:hypothetical protein TSUD_173650 [Trifolium subterraneum]|nr:hypothetical protein TSUD_173650 [Trifolium subterraneum]